LKNKSPKQKHTKDRIGTFQKDAALNLQNKRSCAFHVKEKNKAQDLCLKERQTVKKDQKGQKI